MIVLVDGGSGSVTMADAENLRSLSVELRSCSVEQAAALLAEIGRVDGDHVWLDIARLRALSPRADDAAWSAGFDDVMRYAASQGWIDGSLVRAHLAP